MFNQAQWEFLGACIIGASGNATVAESVDISRRLFTTFNVNKAMEMKTSLEHSINALEGTFEDRMHDLINTVTVK